MTDDCLRLHQLGLLLRGCFLGGFARNLDVGLDIQRDPDSHGTYRSALGQSVTSRAFEYPMSTEKPQLVEIFDAFFASQRALSLVVSWCVELLSWRPDPPLRLRRCKP